MNLRYSPRTVRDPESIHGYLVEKAPKGAINVMIAIYAAIAFIKIHPYGGHSTGIPGVRVVIVRDTDSRCSIAPSRSTERSTSSMFGIRRAGRW